MTTKRIIGASDSEGKCCSCECPNMIEVNLRIKACQCKDKTAAAKGGGEKDAQRIANKMCECLNRSTSKSNFLKIDFIDGHVSDPEDCASGERRRNVLVLKLRDLDVKCENGLRHELYFPAASVAGKTLSPGDYLAYTMSSMGEIHEHKPIPVPDELLKKAGQEGENPTDKTCKKPAVERQMSKSMDDVKPKREKPMKSRSAQNVAEKGTRGMRGNAPDHSMSDMDSIELIIISDEFLNETQNQEVIIVDELKTPTRSKSFQIKKTFLHESKATNGKERGDYFKRAAEAKAKALQMSAVGATTTAGKRLVIISDEYKRKSQENTVRIVRSKEKVSQRPPKSLMGLAKNKTISNAIVDLNSKIISCVLQSYEEPERLENKALEAQLLKEEMLRGRGGPVVGVVPQSSATPEK